ncbi:hypothetical protein P5V15_011357 [Pogonomyrmex californicus]
MNLLSAPQRIGSPRGPTAQAKKKKREKEKEKGSRSVRRTAEDRKDYSEDEKARYAKPRTLPSSPRRRTMMEEPKSLVSGMQTRNTEKLEKACHLLKKKLNEPLFYEHTFQAEIHNNPLNQTDETDDSENLFNNNSEISNYEDAESYDEPNSQNYNNSNSQVEIPSNLLQILDNLTGNNNEINQGEIQENLMPESENEENKNYPRIDQIFIDDYIGEKEDIEEDEKKFDKDEDNDRELTMK